MNDPATRRENMHALSSVVGLRNAARTRSVDVRTRQLRTRSDDTNKRYTSTVAYDLPSLALGLHLT